MQCFITDVNFYVPDSKDWNSVAVVGEYTTPSGPIDDDHFLVIVLRSGNMFLYPTNKIEHLLPPLEKVIGMKVEYGLCNVTDFASRVMFPLTLAGHQLFEFKRTGRGLWEWLKIIRNFGIAEMSTELTQEIKTHLKSLETRRFPL